MEFGWWTTDPEQGKFQVHAVFHGGNLKWLSKQRLISYTDLYRRLENHLGSDARTVFIPTLSFLFLLNKVDYHEKTDSFEYREVGVSR